LFATISKLRRRALPQRVIHLAQSISFVLLVSLMLYVSFSDIRRWVRDAFAEPARAEQTAPSGP
jgi:regulator of sigma E protease